MEVLEILRLLRLLQIQIPYKEALVVLLQFLRQREGAVVVAQVLLVIIIQPPHQ
jgi:hypothetical protein